MQYSDIVVSEFKLSMCDYVDFQLGVIYSAVLKIFVNNLVLDALILSIYQVTQYLSNIGEGDAFHTGFHYFSCFKKCCFHYISS